MTQLITEEEAAKYLNTSSRTLRRARNDGRLPFISIGRLVRYRMDDVHAFIERSIVINDNIVMPSSRRAQSSKHSRRLPTFSELDARD